MGVYSVFPFAAARSDISIQHLVWNLAQSRGSINIDEDVGPRWSLSEGSVSGQAGLYLVPSVPELPPWSFSTVLVPGCSSPEHSSKAAQACCPAPAADSRDGPGSRARPGTPAASLEPQTKHGSRQESEVALKPHLTSSSLASPLFRLKSSVISAETGNAGRNRGLDHSTKELGLRPH